MENVPDRKKQNTKELLKFTMVGGVSTVAHYLVLLISVETLHLDALIATMIGYSIGALINYYLNLRYTFNSNASHRAALPKFVIMVILGFAINAFVMFLMVYVASVNYMVGQLVATITVYCWNFMIGKHWTFK